MRELYDYRGEQLPQNMLKTERSWTIISTYYNSHGVIRAFDRAFFIITWTPELTTQYKKKSIIVLC
jgi:hypothetical protein